MITGTGPTKGDGAGEAGFPSVFAELEATGEAAATIVETMLLPNASTYVVGIGTRTVGKRTGDMPSEDALVPPIVTP